MAVLEYGKRGTVGQINGGSERSRVETQYASVTSLGDSSNRVASQDLSTTAAEKKLDSAKILRFSKKKFRRIF